MPPETMRGRSRSHRGGAAATPLRAIPANLAVPRLPERAAGALARRHSTLVHCPWIPPPPILPPHDGSGAAPVPAAGTWHAPRGGQGNGGTGRQEGLGSAEIPR